MIPNKLFTVTIKHLLEAVTTNDLSKIYVNNRKKDFIFDINVNILDKNDIKTIKTFFYKFNIKIKKKKLFFVVLGDEYNFNLDLKYSKISKCFSFMCYLNVENLIFGQMVQNQLRCLLGSNIKTITFKGNNVGKIKSFIGLSIKDLNKIYFNITQSRSLLDLAFQIGYSKNNIFENIEKIQIDIFIKVYTKNLFVKRILSFLIKTRTLVKIGGLYSNIKYKKIKLTDLVNLK